jgi:hypothetical protein
MSITGIPVTPGMAHRVYQAKQFASTRRHDRRREAADQDLPCAAYLAARYTGKPLGTTLYVRQQRIPEGHDVTVTATIDRSICRRIDVELGNIPVLIAMVSWSEPEHPLPELSARELLGIECGPSQILRFRPDVADGAWITWLLIAGLEGELHLLRNDAEALREEYRRCWGIELPLDMAIALGDEAKALEEQTRSLVGELTA